GAHGKPSWHVSSVGIGGSADQNATSRSRSASAVPLPCHYGRAPARTGAYQSARERPIEQALRAKPLVAGSADPGLQAGGRGFESLRLHRVMSRDIGDSWELRDGLVLAILERIR